MVEAMDKELRSSDKSEFEHLAVICVGNELLHDEGVGPAVAKRLLEGYEFPENVEILDCGTMGFAIMDEIMTHDYILTVDAVEGTGEVPGTVFTFKPEDIGGPQVSRGAHDTRLIDVLDACRLIGLEPVGECVGVQVSGIDAEEVGIGLSPEVEAAVPLVCETVLAMLCNHGVRGIIDRRTGHEVGPR